MPASPRASSARRTRRADRDRRDRGHEDHREAGCLHRYRSDQPYGRALVTRAGVWIDGGRGREARDVCRGCGLGYARSEGRRGRVHVSREVVARGIGCVCGEPQRPRALELGLVLIVDRYERREVGGRCHPIRDGAQGAKLERARKDDEQERQHHERRHGCRAAVVVDHRLTSPRATAVDRTATVVVNTNGRAMRSSVWSETRTGSRHVTNEGSTATTTREGSMPTSRSWSWT